MKFLLWQISIEPYRLAQIQWVLFRLFNIKVKKDPCGHTKSTRGYYCHQPFDYKYCNVVNDGNRHEVVCKCCGHTRIFSNQYIDPNNKEDWI